MSRLWQVNTVGSVFVECRGETEYIGENITEDASQVFHGRFHRAHRLACEPRTVSADSDICRQWRWRYGPTNCTTKGIVCMLRYHLHQICNSRLIKQTNDQHYRTSIYYAASRKGCCLTLLITLCDNNQTFVNRTRFPTNLNFYSPHLFDGRILSAAGCWLLLKDIACLYCWCLGSGGGISRAPMGTPRK